MMMEGVFHFSNLCNILSRRVTFSDGWSHTLIWSEDSICSLHCRQIRECMRPWRHKDTYVGIQPWISFTVEALVKTFWDNKYFFNACWLIPPMWYDEILSFLEMYWRVFSYPSNSFKLSVRFPVILWGSGNSKKVAHRSAGVTSGDKSNLLYIIIIVIMRRIEPHHYYDPFGLL
jgi:hypothetical protein